MASADDASEATKTYIRDMRGLAPETFRTGRDPASGFVYPVFPDQVLPEREDTLLRRFVHDSFTTVLSSMLKHNGQVVTCTDELFGVSDPLDKDVVFRWEEVSRVQADTLAAGRLPGHSRYVEELAMFTSKMDRIQRAYEACPVPNFYLSINIVWDNLKSVHKNILILNKATNTVIWIDPEIEMNVGGELQYIPIRARTFRMLASLIGVRSPTMILPAADICPQIFTRDENCMFWNLLTVLLFILNPGIVRQEDLYQQFYTATGMRPEGKISSQKLLRYIENFKASLMPPKGGRRKTQRRKHRRRKTRRY